MREFPSKGSAQTQASKQASSAVSMASSLGQALIGAESLLLGMALMSWQGLKGKKGVV
jgi:hypothetical protein